MRSTNHGADCLSTTRLIRWLALGDAFAIAAALVVASVVHSASRRIGLEASGYVPAVISILLAQLLLFRMMGLYDPDEILAGAREYGEIALAATYQLFLVAGISYFAGGLPIVSRTWLSFAWLFVLVAVGCERFAARRVVRRARQGGRLRTCVLVVGGSASGVRLAQELSAAHDQGLDVGGFLDEYAPLGRELVPGVRVIGRPADLARNPDAFVADEYVLVVDALPYQRLNELTKALVPRRNLAVRLTVGPLGLLTRHPLVAQRSHVPLLSLRRAEIAGFDAGFKRLFDIVIATVALICIAPLGLGTIAIAVVRRRTPIFRVERIHGRGGGALRLPLLTHGASKLLPVRGMPAFVAVLAGTLSIVGPRPRLLKDAPAPLTLELAAIKPGLTGPWRLSGAASSAEKQTRDDLTYIRAYSIWEDLRIVYESLKRLASKHTAAQLARWQIPPLEANTAELPEQWAATSVESGTS